MNEDELKNIWRREEKIPLKKIDMEYIQQYADNTQNLLQKLSRKEMIAGIIFAALFVFDFVYSGNFYFVLFSAASIFIYLIWKKSRDAKIDRLNHATDVRLFLISKEKELKRNVKMQRVFGFISVLIFLPLMNLLNGSFYERMANPTRYMISMIITFIAVQIGLEIFVRRNYNPILEDLRHLIDQFDDGENE